MGLPRRYGVVYHRVDGALRYHRVLDEIEDFWRDDLRILEIGSGSGGIAQYLAHPVSGVDSQFDRTAPNAHPNLVAIQGSAAALPIEDECFDVVLRLEMLEHIPRAERSQSISEMYRVLVPGGRIVLTFPSGEDARTLDRWLNESYRAKFGEDHPWLIEHLREGVPDPADVQQELEALGASVRLSHHFSVPAFVLVQGLYSVLWGGPIFGRIFRSRPFATVVFRFLRRDPNPPAYRVLIVAAKPK